jgi:ABC-2 type transport system permease protein
MNKLWIIMQREFFARFVKKGYWVFTVIGLIVMIGLTFLPTISHFIDSHTRTKVVLNDPNQIVAPAILKAVEQNPDAYSLQFTLSAQPGVPNMTPDQLISYMDGLHAHTVVVIKGESAANAQFQVEQNGTMRPSTLTTLKTLFNNQVLQARMTTITPDTQQVLSAPVSFDVHQLQIKSKSSDQLIQSQMLVYFMEMLLMFTLMMYGVWVAQGVIEEKSNRIIEMMLIAVKPWQILFGKVLGMGMVALVQYAVWTVGVVVSLLVRNSMSSIHLDTVPAATIAMFPLFFVLGYLFYAVLFGIGGSLVYRAEEQQLAVGPVSILMVLAFYSSMFVFTNPDSSFAVAVSFVPFLSPLTMFARVALGDVPLWQVLVSIAIMVVSILGEILLGASIYRRHALKTSGKSGWKLLLPAKRQVEESVQS